MKIEQLLCKEHKRDIWYIEPVLSAIFEFSTFQDLKAFNTVCKKWNQLTNPIIHRSIKLTRGFRIQNDYVFIENHFGYADIDVEASKCIVNNAKHASFVKSFYFTEKLKPHAAIEFFETFKCLTKLKISDIKISQDQFLCMIKPLDKLEELDLSSITIEEIKRKRLYKEFIQLPQTLNKLTLDSLKLVGNPMLFVETINSHSNLKEVVINSCSINDLLIPFNAHYPSLKTLEYKDNSSKNHQYLVNVFKSNPQLLKLIISLECYNRSLDSSISQYLTNLEEIVFGESIYYHLRDENIINIFSIPKNVKKLKLNCGVLRLCLLSSIFKGCSELDECILNINETIIYSKSLSMNTGIPSKIKKLKISTGNLDESLLDAILINCSNLTELDIILPKQLESYFEIINQRCPYLERLKLQPLRNSYFEEYISLEFLSKKFSFKYTLTSLIIYKFKFEPVNLKYIKNYPKLNFIKLINQPRFAFNSRFDKISNSFIFGKSALEAGIDIDYCPDYKVRMYNYTAFTCDIEMNKIQENIDF